MQLNEWLHDLGQDAVFATRQTKKAPTLALLVVLTLGISVCANTVVFSVVNSVLLEPLPYFEPERLVSLWEITPQGGQKGTSDPNFVDFRKRNRSLVDLAAVHFSPPQLILHEGEPEQFTGMACTGSLFTLLGIRPMLGRTFSAEEEYAGSKSRILVLSYGLWVRRFGADPHVVGKTIILNNEKWNVLGIMPSDFEFMWKTDIWIPYAPDPASDRSNHMLRVFGRLEPGVTLEQAQADMTAITKHLGQEYPPSNQDWGVQLVSFPDWIVGPNVRQITLVLQLAVALMLILACANVSSLFIAQATVRQREIDLRVALGAGRARIARQLLTESVFLSLLAAGTGLILAYWAIPVVRSLNPDALPRLEKISLDTNVFVFSLLVSLGAGLLSGVAPALQTTRTSLYDSLRGGRQVATRSGRRLRDVLVVGELALAVTLLIGAGLLVRSFRQLQETELGFQPRDVLSVSLSLPENEYPVMSPKVTAFYRDVLESIEALPGVTSAGATMTNPLKGPYFGNQIAPESAQDQSEFVRVHFRSVTSGFFRALGIPVLQGRTFDDRDRFDEAQSEIREGVAVISARLAERLWPTEIAVDKRVRWSSLDGSLARVIGVVGDINDFMLQADSPPMIYFYHEQMRWPHMTLVIRTKGKPTKLSSAVRAAIWKVDKNLPVPSMEPLGQNITHAVMGPRFNTQLLSTFAFIALVMAVMGIYGIISYSVARRSREIGVRMALGARPQNMMTLVLRHALGLIAVGTALGIGGAFGFTRFLQGLLYETSPTDVATYAGVATVLALAGLLTSLIPASRAAKVDPLVSLRAE